MAKALRKLLSLKHAGCSRVAPNFSTIVIFGVPHT